MSRGDHVGLGNSPGVVAFTLTVCKCRVIFWYPKNFWITKCVWNAVRCWWDGSRSSHWTGTSSRHHANGDCRGWSRTPCTSLLKGNIPYIGPFLGPLILSSWSPCFLLSKNVKKFDSSPMKMKLGKHSSQKEKPSHICTQLFIRTENSRDDVLFPRQWCHRLGQQMSAFRHHQRAKGDVRI